MTTTIIKPSIELRPYVRYYWVLKSREKFSILTFPIGCPQIIFHRRSPLLIPELSVSQDKFTISGQVNFSAHIASNSDTEMIVAVFYPHTIGMFIDTPPSAFYNSEISGFDIGNKNLNGLSTRIFNSENTHQSIKILESWLLSKLKYCSVQSAVCADTDTSILLISTKKYIAIVSVYYCFSCIFSIDFFLTHQGI